MPLIASLHAREILDSRGNPTLEVDVRLDDGTIARAAVPSGGSTGSREACELRDGDPARFAGKGVLTAVANINDTIASELRGGEASDQEAIDACLLALDGTVDKRRLGANAILGVSQAVARAAAASGGVPLYRRLTKGEEPLLPVPMFNVLNGGVHADKNVDIQEFMIAPVGASSFREALRMGVAIYQELRSFLKRGRYGTAVGDEGGFAPNLSADIEALELLVDAIDHAGLWPGRDVVIVLDSAASELFEDGRYVFRKSRGRTLASEDMVELYDIWVKMYPIWSIEDGLAENDWNGWRLLTERLGGRVQLVGDDIFATNPAIISQAVAERVANAALIKLNQIGTVTETLRAIETARSGGYATVISHRSGETSDDFIADLTVGTAAGQIKTGAPARGERVAKYNQLLRIEKELGAKARFAGPLFAAEKGFRRTSTRVGEVEPD